MVPLGLLRELCPEDERCLRHRQRGVRGTEGAARAQRREREREAGAGRGGREGRGERRGERRARVTQSGRATNLQLLLDRLRQLESTRVNSFFFSSQYIASQSSPSSSSIDVCDYCALSLAVTCTMASWIANRELIVLPLRETGVKIPASYPLPSNAPRPAQLIVLKNVLKNGDMSHLEFLPSLYIS
jgi:hypothetical protein